MEKELHYQEKHTFRKRTILLEEVNACMALYQRVIFETRQEYSIEYVQYIFSTFLEAAGMTTDDFVHGKGKHKTMIQRFCEKGYDC